MLHESNREAGIFVLNSLVKRNDSIGDNVKENTGMDRTSRGDVGKQAGLEGGPRDS